MNDVSHVENKQLNPLDLIQSIATNCNGFLDRETLFYRAAWLIAQHLHVPRVMIGITDNQQLNIITSSNGPIEELKRLGPLKIPLESAKAYQDSIKTNTSSIILHKENTDHSETHSYLGRPLLECIVPIALNQSTHLGLIIIQSQNYQDAIVLKQHLQALSLTSTTLAVYIHAQQTHQHMLERDRYTKLLTTVRQEADQQVSLQLLLKSMTDSITHFLPVRAIAIYLLEYNHLTLYTSTNGFQAPLRRGLSIRSRNSKQANEPTMYTYLQAPENTIDIELYAGITLLGVLLIEPLYPIPSNQHQLLKEVGNTFGELLERNRLFNTMHATNERTTLFARIVHIIRQSINIYDIIDEVNQTLAIGLQADWCSLGLKHNNATMTWYGTYTNTRKAASYTSIASILRQEISQAIEKQQTGIIDDLTYTTQINTEQRQQLIKHNVRALVWSPLQHGEQWIGALCIFTLDVPHRWSLDELRLLSDVADQFMLAYRQMQLYEAEQQRRRELEALQDIITAISGELNIESLCTIAVHKIVNVFNVSAATVLMWRNTHETMKPIASVGLSQNFLSKLVFEPKTVQKWTERFPPPQDLYIANIQADALNTDLETHLEGLSGLYAHPLMVNSTFSGWLQIYQRGPTQPLTPEARTLAAAIANQISQAMDIARQYEEEHLLRTDAEQSYHHLKAVLEELEQTRERLIRSENLRALGELASGVAHDFNNLLASILGNTQMLLQDTQSEESSEALKVIEQAARDGAVTVRRIQEFARSSETIYEEVVNLRNVVDVGLEFARPSWRDKAQQRGITIQIETELQDAYVLGSAAELREVFVNLLVNAVDALPTGGIITIRVWQAKETASFNVCDNGLGISPENRARIFDPFFTTKPLSQGTGLGLAVALSIIQRHRGTLDVETIEPQGSCFYVSLPRHQHQHVPARPVQQTHSGSCTMLIVDDDANILNVLLRLLKKDKHEVDQASSGEEALQMLKEKAYDIIISDLGMPGINGLELLNEARELYPTIRTMLLTGWGYQLEGDYPSQSIDVIMSKPFELQTLRKTIAELVAQSQHS